LNLLYQAAEKRPSAALSGRLTVLSAWQDVAPYPSRRHPSSLVIAAQLQVPVVRHFLRPQDFGRSRERDFAKLNLHPCIFEQPEKIHFFSNLSLKYRSPVFLFPFRLLARHKDIML
jgi:hypothetical protein